ncbi:MAG: patatin-like phospholipase family protein [Candidatus Hydrogenedentota bacterium]|nr:MAG: patatin-like phospholipase family protein [Candidatus Hydrogenedentota bacterium]
MNPTDFVSDLSHFFDIITGKPKMGLTIAGGGCKAFFGLGVGSVLTQAGLPIRSISGTSAGTAMGLSLFSTSPDDLVAEFCDLVRKNPSNFYMSDLVTGKKPFPHERMYRYIVAKHLNMQKLQSSKIHFVFNALRLPRHLEPDENKMRLTSFMVRIVNAFRKENANNEKGIYEPLMSKIAEEEGLREVIFTEKELDTPEKIEDAILASSSAPPVTSVQKLFDGYYYLDGGIMNNLPVRHIAKEVDFVIAVYYRKMTRIFFEKSLLEREKPLLQKIYYAYPDGSLPVNTWDYTDPDGVQKTYDEGRRMGEQIVRLMKLF